MYKNVFLHAENYITINDTELHHTSNYTFFVTTATENIIG